jgi:parallel beta-helix repeat protein
LTNETLLGTRLLRGIHIYGSSHNIVENNTITNIRNFTDIGGTMRSYAAIDVEGSLERPLETSINNTLVQNRLENNSCGIWINTLVANTKLYHNAFVNNIRQVNDVLGTSTAWDNGYSSGGNYWSDYEGTDTNGDNIGDTPYRIDLGNADRYPLMRPPE